MAKIPYVEEMAIVGMLKSGMNIQEIRKEVGYSQCTISRIAKEHGAKPARSYAKITPDIIKKIMELDSIGKSRSAIAKELMVGTSTVGKIIRKQKSKSDVEQWIDTMCKAPNDGEEVQLTIDPPDPPDGGQDPEELRDPFEMIQNALREINGAIELIKGMYYELDCLKGGMAKCRSKN